MFSAKEVESGAIFEKCTIQEISDIEKKLRQDIEKKKEDLRQMVGERYRELIEAADTITEMKNGTEKVVSSSITCLKDLCQKLKQSKVTFLKGSFQATNNKASNSMTKDQVNKFNYAVCMKLLMETPSKIWLCLDDNEYLKASRIFLAAHHVHLYIQSGMGVHTAQLINILVRQWTTISHLKFTILKTIENRLKDAHLPSELVAECLCSSALLQELSVEDVFKKFLDSRVEQVKMLFDSCGLDATVKPLICDVITTLLVTVRQVHDIFLLCKDGEGESNDGLLIGMLSQILNSDFTEFFGPNSSLSNTAMQYLPQQVLGFRPSLKFQIKPLEKSFVISYSSQFVKNCSHYINKDMGDLLSYVNTVKVLSSIRDEIYLIVKKNSETCDWSSLCNDVIGHNLDLWGDLLQQHFLERLKSLLKEQVDSVVVSTKSHISKTLEEFADSNSRSLLAERNISSYVWSESSGDIPPNAAWSPLNQKVGNFAREGGLHMKAKGFTPGVQSLCQLIDQKMKVLLDDVISYVNPSILQSSSDALPAPNSHVASEAHQQSSSISGFFLATFSSISSSLQSNQQITLSLEEQFTDKLQVQELLQSTCTSCLNGILEFMKEQSSAYQQELATSTNSRNSAAILDRILYLGRISNGICELSPSLQSCMSDCLLDEIARLPKSVKSTSSRTVSHPKNNESKKWMTVVEEMNKFFRGVYIVWSDQIVSCLSEKFRLSLMYKGDNSYAAFMSSCTQWDTIGIEEENEEGTAVKSNIKVPMQTSFYVQDLFYNLCLNVNSVGGHVIPGTTISNLSKKLLENITSYYNELLSYKQSSSSKLLQCQALQMWFDVKYITTMLSQSKDETKALDTNVVGSILEALENHVDPFDLDVFKPHLNKHLQKHIQRTSVLYGLAFCSERPPSSSSLSHFSSSSGQEQHHVVPLSAGSNRFTVLPLPQQVGKSQLDVGSSSNLKLLSAQLSQPSLLNASNNNNNSSNKSFSTLSSQSHQNSPPPPRAGSSSFLEQMSTLFGSSTSATLYLK